MFAFLRVILIAAVILTAGEFFFIVPIAATIQGLQVGMEAPDFLLYTIKGEKKKFSELAGAKLTAVIFWSTWSENSDKALLRLEKLFQKCKERGFSVVAVNVDGQKASETAKNDIVSKTGKLKLSFPVLIDDGLTVFHDYGVIAVPTTVILDKDRIIRYELSGFPLTGSEEMMDFVSNTLEGKTSEKTVEKAGYKPDKKAVRFFNTGSNTLKSELTSASAEVWFKKAIETDPKFVLPYISLGKFYGERENAAGAAEEFQKALDIDPLNPVALCELAFVMIHTGKINQGRTLIEKALKTDEAYSPCYYYSGWAYAKEGKLDQAFGSFEHAARLNPLDPNPFIYQGRACEQNNLPQKAAASYKKALEIILQQK
jgi:tetratricopeptide (TPR) repeat protein